MSVAECNLDLNFVVDSSGSIEFDSPLNWGIMLQFIANVTRQFTIGPNDVQVSFVIFGTTARVEWGLTRYQDKNSLINAILRVAYLGNEERTNLNDALILTRTEIFASGRGTRAGAIKATIILTDGIDNIPEEGTPLTLQNAAALKQAGIVLYAIGIGDSVDRPRLLQIVSNQDDYYQVDDFNALGSLLGKLGTGFCVTTPAPAPGIRRHFIVLVLRFW